jgi:hypothetical protein
MSSPFTNSVVSESFFCPEVLSAGVLCYAYADSTHDIYFLLGRDRPSPEWPRGSTRWSDFGGGLLPGETETEGAAREFVEESMAIVALPQETAGILTSGPFVNQTLVQTLLEQKKYTFRVAANVVDRNQGGVEVTEETPTQQRRVRVCYVNRIPWQPDLPEKFDRIKEALDKLGDTENMEEVLHCYHNLSNDMQNHPALEIETDLETGQIVGVYVKPEYREKQQIGWWSLHRLKSILRNGGSYKNKFCFRAGFLCTLAVIIEHFSAMEVVCQQLVHNRREFIVETQQSPSETEVDTQDPEEPLTDVFLEDYPNADPDPAPIL